MNQVITEILNKSNLHYRIINHSDMSTPIKSPTDFANALGYDISRITKTVFFRSKTSDVHVMAVCSSNKKFDLNTISNFVGSKVELASLEELKNIIGHPPTGVSPIGIPQNILLLIDCIILSLPTILIGSGYVGKEIEITPSDLLILTKGKVSHITMAS